MSLDNGKPATIGDDLESEEGGESSGGWDDSALIGRESLVRHLTGSGIELGPGHHPFPLPLPGVKIRYVDRWLPDESRALFPELATEQGIPIPDVVANFDTDRLAALPDASEDFVICSHVLEHLADPIGLLNDMHRVVRPEGTVLILLPDRRRTFDRDRAPTTLDHLVAEYHAQVTTVDDEHILDFLRGVDKYLGHGSASYELALRDPAHLELHRNRSVHVHCWDNVEFLPVILYAIRELRHQWNFVDGLLTEEMGNGNIEFGFVLRRTSTDLDPSVLEERFARVWNSWRKAKLLAIAKAENWKAVNASLNSELTDTFERCRELQEALEGSQSQVSARDAYIQDLESRLKSQREEIDTMVRTRTFRYTASARRAYGRLIGQNP